MQVVSEFGDVGGSGPVGSSACRVESRLESSKCDLRTQELSLASDEEMAGMTEFSHLKSGR